MTWVGFVNCKLGGHAPGWQAVPVHDPVVQDAANHAVKTIQQRSNSLFPYELQEVVHAKAEVSFFCSFLQFFFLFYYFFNGKWDSDLMVFGCLLAPN